MAEFDPDAFLAKQDKRKERNTGFDPDAFLAKTQPESLSQTFGRSAASLADTALNAITGILDYGAYPFARAYYGMTGNRTPEQASALAQQETTSPKDVVGRAFGVTGTAGYENAPLRSAGRFIGEQLGENVIQPVSQFTGAPEADVSNVLNSLAMGVAPVAGKVAAPVARTAAKIPGAVAQVPGAVAALPDVGRGFAGTLSGRIAKPGTEPILYKQTAPIMEPASKTHIPADVMAEYQAGRITAEQANQAAIPYTAEQIAALERTGGNVPYSGNVAQATGAMLAEPYTSFRGYLPDLALAGIGGFMTGGPLGALGFPALNITRKGIQAYNAAKTATAANELGNLKFTRLTPEQRAALQAAETQAATTVAGPVTPVAEPVTTAPTVTTQAINPDVPLLTYNPSPSVLYGSETGIVGKTPQEVVTADLAQRYAPQPVVTATPEAQPAPSTKALTVSETAGKTAEQLAAEQKILDFINARRGIVANDPAANRQNFASQIEQTRQQLEFAREQNKQMFGDRAKAMNERAGEGSMTPSQKDQITDATAVRYMINQTTQTAVKQQGKKVSYSEPQLNELATQAGITLDWKTAPDISNMGVGEARKAINKWMFDSIDAQSPELGLKTRKESLRAQERRAERESAGQPEATLSAEETEALRKRQEKLLGKQTQTQAEPKQQYANAAEMRKDLYGKMPNDELEALVNKTFPSVNTLKEKMNKSKGEENKAMDETLRQKLEAIKAQGKYRGPKDAMEMMTGFDDMTPSQQAFKMDEVANTLAGKPTYGEYFDAQGNRIVSQERYPHLPEFFRNKAADRDVPIVRKYDPEGNRIPMGEDWSASDPAPLKVVVKKRLSKEPYEIYWERDGEVILEKGNINKRFKIDPTVTVKRVEITQNPVGGDDALVRKYHGTSNKGEEVVINEYGDGAMSGTFIDAKGKERNKLY